MRAPTAVFAIIACLLLAACGMAPPPERQSEAARKANEHHELRDAINRPIDKAKAVDDETLKAAEKQRQAIEDSGG